MVNDEHYRAIRELFNSPPQGWSAEPPPGCFSVWISACVARLAGWLSRKIHLRATVLPPKITARYSASFVELLELEVIIPVPDGSDPPRTVNTPIVQLPSTSELLLGAATSLLRGAALRLPEAGLKGEFMTSGIDIVAVARYRKFFGNPAGLIPLGYFYGLAQRAQLALMLNPHFPYAIPGLVHTQNTIRRLAEPVPGISLTLVASVFPKPLADGAQEVIFEVEIVQGGSPMVSCQSHYRVPRKHRTPAAVRGEPDSLPESYEQTAWHYEKPSIRRYAWLSGDYNPLHLSSLVARAFGFRGAIAHGMYSVGLAAAHIERAASSPLAAISVAFRRPIFLPAQAVFGYGKRDARQGAYGVLLPDLQQLALDGTWELFCRR